VKSRQRPVTLSRYGKVLLKEVWHSRTTTKEQQQQQQQPQQEEVWTVKALVVRTLLQKGTVTSLHVRHYTCMLAWKKEWNKWKHKKREEPEQQMLGM
jgi:hypothetical protein